MRFRSCLFQTPLMSFVVWLTCITLLPLSSRQDRRNVKKSWWDQAYLVSITCPSSPLIGIEMMYFFKNWWELVHTNLHIPTALLERRATRPLQGHWPPHILYIRGREGSENQVYSRCCQFWILQKEPYFSSNLFHCFRTFRK